MRCRTGGAVVCASTRYHSLSITDALYAVYDINYRLPSVFRPEGLKAFLSSVCVSQVYLSERCLSPSIRALRIRGVRSLASAGDNRAPVIAFNCRSVRSSRQIGNTEDQHAVNYRERILNAPRCALGRTFDASTATLCFSIARQTVDSNS